ncbi:MAG: hypothetical protein GXY52_06440 [Chloroflexi bacterium]|nr:hypothetical protein [Chloroflexota bacterium]
MYVQLAHILGPRLINQIGSRRISLGDLLGASAYWLKRIFSRPENRAEAFKLADGIRLVTNGWAIHGTSGYTLGRYIFTYQHEFDRSFVIHEYVHVLQWRAQPCLFLLHYGRRGFRNWPELDEHGWPSIVERRNPYEVQAMQVEALYRREPRLPNPWQLKEELLSDLEIQ